ncbi:MAG: hypothetical protein QXT67_09125, partial [Candidatus Bathyarchaeia archaeon]
NPSVRSLHILSKFIEYNAFDKHERIAAIILDFGLRKILWFYATKNPLKKEKMETSSSSSLTS